MPPDALPPSPKLQSIPAIADHASSAPAEKLSCCVRQASGGRQDRRCERRRAQGLHAAPGRRQERKSRSSRSLITELALTGSSFARCGSTGKASTSARSKRRVRRLWGDGKGAFRTKGRHAAATVRGTRWLVEDRCDGTLVKVSRGRVEVRDKIRLRTVQVRAGRSYLARLR